MICKTNARKEYIFHEIGNILDKNRVESRVLNKKKKKKINVKRIVEFCEIESFYVTVGTKNYLR